MKSIPEAKAAEPALIKANTKKNEREEMETEDVKIRDTQEERQRELFDSLVQRAVGKYRHALSVTESITSRDMQEYIEHSYDENSWNAFGATTYEKRAQAVRDDLEKYIPELIENMRTLEGKFLADLREASGKWISEESAEKWRQRLKSQEYQHWQKKDFMENTFPALLKDWKKAAEDRDALEVELKEQKITIKEMPEVANILNKKAFLSLHYRSRVDQIEKAKALIKANKLNRLWFIRYIEGELQECVKIGILHPSKVGSWMQRGIAETEQTKFLATLEWCKKNWQKTKQKFNELNGIMQQEGVPRGFTPWDEDTFLLKHYNQRTSYCALLSICLKNADRDNKKLAHSLLKIRYNLNSQDWEGAETDLAHALSQWPDDPELASMQTFLECHKPRTETKKEKKETPDPMKLVTDIRQMLGRIEGELHPLYKEALLAGPEVFECFLQLNANNKWVHDHGFATEADDQRLALGRPPEEAEIVDDCTTAQSLVVGEDGNDAVMRKVKANADNMSFRFWTRIVPKNTSYMLHASYIENLHQPLKSALRELDKAGYRFTLSGRPEPKAGTIIRKEQIKAAETTHALAA